MSGRIVHSRPPKYVRRKRPQAIPPGMPAIVGRSEAERAADRAEALRRADKSGEVWLELVRRATEATDEEDPPVKKKGRHH